MKILAPNSTTTVRIGSFMWLFTASIGLFSLVYIIAENENRIEEVTARSLEFLNIYRANVAAHHGGPVAEEQKKQFLEDWKGSYYSPEETLTKLYNSVEKDWRYALDLASSNEDNFSAMVITLNIKIEAYLQFLYYLPCFTMPVNPERYDSDHCQNLAAQFMILSYIGTDQIIKKLMLIAESAFTIDNHFSIMLFQRCVAEFYNKLKYNLREKMQRPPIGDSVPDDSLNKYLHVVANTEEFLTLNKLSLRMMFGNFPLTIQQDEYTPHWYDAAYVKFIWQNAKDINKHLTGPSGGDEKYDVTRAVYEIIIQRAEFWKLTTKDSANNLTK